MKKITHKTKLLLRICLIGRVSSKLVHYCITPSSSIVVENATRQSFSKTYNLTYLDFWTWPSSPPLVLETLLELPLLQIVVKSETRSTTFNIYYVANQLQYSHGSMVNKLLEPNPNPQPDRKLEMPSNIKFSRIN